MREYGFTIDGRLPSLNEYINACRTNRFAGASMKKKCQEGIIWCINMQLPKVIESPVELSFTWYEENQKRDLDNVCFAKKFILDALVESGRLKNDGWRDVLGFEDRFFIDNKNPRIEVVLKVKE